MASVCIVVGFAGRGSLEYMKHSKNCYLAEDGDVPWGYTSIGGGYQSCKGWSRCFDASLRSGDCVAVQPRKRRTRSDEVLAKAYCDSIFFRALRSYVRRPSSKRHSFQEWCSLPVLLDPCDDRLGAPPQGISWSEPAKSHFRFEGPAPSY